MKYVALLFLMILSLAGCGEDRDIVDPGLQYLPQTSPENVIRNLVTSYKWRDIDGYAVLLADDFQFYFDEGARQRNHELPIFWTRVDDIDATGKLFHCPVVSDIHFEVTTGPPTPENQVGREDWVYIDVIDVLLEVERVPAPGETEGTTFRIDSSRIRWYFRKGKAATDAGSESWYLVEWRDYGAREKPAGATGQAVEATTWAELKAFCQ